MTAHGCVRMVAKIYCGSSYGFDSFGVATASFGRAGIRRRMDNFFTPREPLRYPKISTLEKCPGKMLTELGFYVLRLSSAYNQQSTY